MPAGRPSEPALGGSAFVNVQVIQEHMQFPLRVVAPHLVQETQEVDSGPSSPFAPHPAGGNFQGGPQRVAPVPDVFMGPTAGLLGPQRQPGLGTVEGLNSRLLVDTQDQRLFGRMQVKPHHVQLLGFKIRVRAAGGKLSA